MIKKEQIMNKYKEIFGFEKDYFEVLEECHEQISLLEKINFLMTDFKSEEAYIENIKQIDLYRKYSILDEFIKNNLNSFSLQKINEPNLNYITYHDIVCANKLFQETFKDMGKFYIKRGFMESNEKIQFLNVLTINDIFDNISDSSLKFFYVTTERKSYFSVHIEDYEYVYKLPFEDGEIHYENDSNNYKELVLKLENNKVLYGYLYLIKEYITSNYNNIDKSKEFTTIFKEYGLTYDHYLKYTKDDEKLGKFHIFKTNVKPFLIETKDIKCYPDPCKPRFESLLYYEWEGYSEEEQVNDFLKYFLTLKINYQKILDYLKDNWIINLDIGENYNIDYNKVGTKEDIDNYRSSIIAKKYFDIKFNIILYKRYNLFKYGYLDKGDLNDLPEYKEFILSYLNQFKYDKSSKTDNRIDLDNNDIFRLSFSIYDNSWIFENNSFKHSNFASTEYNVFDEGTPQKGYALQINLVKFINEYNKLNGKNKLSIDYEWYFPHRPLKDYIENNSRQFSKNWFYGFNQYDFEIIFNNFYIDEENKIKTKFSKPSYFESGIKSLDKKHHPSYYYEHPMILYTYISKKDLEKIMNGNHPYFKSEFIKNKAKEKKLLLENSTRFLSKGEIIKNQDFDVIYVGRTDDDRNIHKGMTGKIVQYDNKYVISDSFGNEHSYSLVGAKNSLWVHVSTLNYSEFYNKLSNEERYFLQKNNLLSNKDIKLLN